ncbi:Potassium efflux system KefA protein / Small-conductance mechanosensitive channel [hydrothermal vent metagenome]|uniref:Potassium efflux system KefA protein / Small-conductance mechanosensitive channel n=1 Tax=hydrothermal vent metagenome TaxID=652676 RepID=A0A3B1BNM5_9ZZZZ
MEQLAKFNTQLKPFLYLFSENHLLQALIVIIGGYLLARIFSWSLTTIIYKLTHRSQTTLDDQFIELVRSPIFYSILLIAASIAGNLALDGKLEVVFLSLLKTAAVIIWSTFILRLARMLLRAASQTADKFNVISTQTLPLFENLAILIIIAIAVYFVFNAWNIDMTAWLASAGIVGIAIGFASKDTLANLFSGVFILADAPYKIGDYIVLDSGERGAVTHIGIRSTRILTRDDVEVTIPNSIMGNTKIINETGGPHTKYRIRLKVGVAYGSDIEQVKDTLMKVALKNTSVCEDPEPRVRFRSFGGSSLDFELLSWVDEPVLRGRVLDELNSEVYLHFQENNIEIPFAQQDIYIKSWPGEINARGE